MLVTFAACPGVLLHPSRSLTLQLWRLSGSTGHGVSLWPQFPLLGVSLGSSCGVLGFVSQPFLLGFKAVVTRDSGSRCPLSAFPSFEATPNCVSAVGTSVSTDQPAPREPESRTHVEAGLRKGQEGPQLPHFTFHCNLLPFPTLVICLQVSLQQ